MHLVYPGYGRNACIFKLNTVVRFTCPNVTTHIGVT